MARALSDTGLTVLRFDPTGLGASAGDFAETDFGSYVADIQDAIAALEHHGAKPSLLVGHSLGGLAALQAASQLPTVRAVVLLGTPSEAKHVTRQLADQLATIERQGEATVTLAGRTFRITRRFLQSLDTIRPEAILQGLARPVLIMHAPEDATVPINHGRRLFQAAREPKGFIALEGADHLLSDPAQAREAGELMATWAAQSLELADR